MYSKRPCVATDPRPRPRPFRHRRLALRKRLAKASTVPNTTGPDLASVPCFHVGPDLASVPCFARVAALRCARDIRCAGTMVSSEKAVAYVC